MNIPLGKLSDITRIVNYIKNKFKQVSIKIEIPDQQREISKSEYEDKIREAINQAGVIIEVRILNEKIHNFA